ncbi:hypothetical protein RI367_003906 [Sorochytrium milnesiophthora]
MASEEQHPLRTLQRGDNAAAPSLDLSASHDTLHPAPFDSTTAGRTQLSYWERQRSLQNGADNGEPLASPVQVIVDDARPYYEAAMLNQTLQEHQARIQQQQHDMAENDLADAVLPRSSSRSGRLNGNTKASNRTQFSLPPTSLRINSNRDQDSDSDSDEYLSPLSPHALAYRKTVSTRMQRKSTRRAPNGDEFNWDDDVPANGDDQSVVKEKRHRCNFMRSFTARFPYWLKCLVKAIIGDAIIFAALGAPDYVFGLGASRRLPLLQWRSTANISGMPLIVLALFLVMVWTLRYVTLFGLSVVPNILERSLGLVLGDLYSGQLSEYLNYFRKLRNDLTWTIWSIVAWAIWGAFIVIPGWTWKDKDWLNATPPHSAEWWNSVGQFLMSVFIVSAVWTARRLILEVIKTHFHRRAYKDRINRSKFANSILEKLSVAIHSPYNRFQDPSSTQQFKVHKFKGANGKFADPVDTTDAPMNQSSPSSSFAPKKKKKGIQKAGMALGKALNTVAVELNNVILDPNALVHADTLPTTVSEANSLARSLYYALVQPGKDELYPQDFVPYFKTERDAMRAFRLFDADGDGSVTKSELKSIIGELMHEKLSIEASIEDVASAVGSLGYILGFMGLVLMILIISQVMNILDTTKLLSSMAAVVLPASFIFGGTCKDMFESIIFLFIMHPFDVGDRVEIDGKGYLVRSMSIQTTILERGDGRIVYAPNVLLKGKLIDNTRRSGRQNETILIKVDIRTTDEQLQALRQTVLEFLQSESKEFVPAVTITIQEVLIAEKALRLTMNIEHRTNWQDAGKKGGRRNRLMFALRSAVLALNIECPSTAAPETNEH